MRPSIYSQFAFSVICHVNYRFITGYTEFRIKTDTSVCSDSRNAICPSRCLRQQRAERTGNALPWCIRIPFENWRDHRFLWCVPTTFFFFRLEVQVLISDYICVVRSRHGCNVRCYRIHRCEPTGDAGCAKWRSWWLRSRVFGWYQRCTLFQLLGHFVLIFSTARSLPIAVASCAVIGAAVGTFDTAGQSLRGDQEALSYEEKRKRFFKQTSSSPPLSSLQ